MPILDRVYPGAPILILQGSRGINRALARFIPDLMKRKSSAQYGKISRRIVGGSASGSVVPPTVYSRAPTFYSRGSSSLARSIIGGALKGASYLPGTVGSIARTARTMGSLYSRGRSLLRRLRGGDPKPPYAVVGKKHRWVTKGTFVGKFSRPNKRSGKKLLKYNKTGTVLVKELTGTVSDPDVCYVINEAINQYDFVQAIIEAIVRQLFEKAGIRIVGRNDIIASLDGSNSGQGKMYIRLNAINISTPETPIDHPVLTSDTLKSMATKFFAAFINAISLENSSGGGGNTYNTYLMTEMILYKANEANNAINQQLAVVKFDECKIDVYGQAELKVQNRTKASSGSGDAEDVSNNPLQGRLYYFKGVPRPKSLQLSSSNGSNGNSFGLWNVTTGVRTLTGAADFGNADFKEPPPPTYFWNCKASSKVRLDPGQIKTYTVKQGFVMMLPAILKKLRMQFSTAGNSLFTNHTIFKSCMIGMEDVINVNASESIGIAFEIERILAVRAFVNAKKYCRTSFEQVSV